MRAMATLEMVPLRSMMPPTGLVTLRHQRPPLNIPTPGVAELRQLVEGAGQTTTSQVQDPEPAAEAADPETAARKGGQAR